MSSTDKKKQKTKKPYVAAQDQVVRTGGQVGTIFLASMALLFILVGCIMLFVDGVQEQYLVYMISALLIALGIGLIVKYYVTQAYRNMHDYGFSSGALVVILGCSALAHASTLAGQLSILSGLLVLTVAVVMLQQALQLHIMRKSVWPFVLTVAIVTLFASIVLLFDLHFLTDRIDKIEYWILLIAGILTLLCMIIVAIGVWMFMRQEKEEMLRMEQERQQALDRAVEQDRLEQKLKGMESSEDVRQIEVPEETETLLDPKEPDASDE